MRRTNLTADASDPAEIAFHVIDSLAPIAFAKGAEREALEAALAEGASALDLGSGAGFPGLVLAAAFEARFTLVEARRKRASYLQVAAHEMGLENVAIERRRASARVKLAGGLYHLVTARAFGTSTELYEIAAAALRPGGILLLYASADQVLDDASRSERQPSPSTIPARMRCALPNAPRGRIGFRWRASPRRARPCSGAKLPVCLDRSLNRC